MHASVNVWEEDSAALLLPSRIHTLKTASSAIPSQGGHHSNTMQVLFFACSKVFPTCLDVL